MLHGDSGIGKSAMTLQAADILFAETYGYKISSDYQVRDKAGNVLRENERPWFVDFRTALHDGVDLTGVPHVIKNKGGKFITCFALPEMLAELDPRGGVWFFDEINRGPMSTINAAFSLSTTGTVGKASMPKTWLTAAAINDKDVGVSRLPAALNRRFRHLDATTDLEDSCTYAIRCNWEPVVIAYLRTFPMDLNYFDPKERVGPNPRAWEAVSQLVSQNLMNRRVQQSMFAGDLGESRAIKFGAFLDMYKKLPSIDAIMLSPKKADVPTEPGTLYAISAALARRANPDNFEKVMVYLERLPMEYNLFAVTDAVTRDKGLQSTNTFTKWAVAHQEVTL